MWSTTYTYYITHHKRTQIIGSNWISDNVLEKDRGQIGKKNRHLYENIGII